MGEKAKWHCFYPGDLNPQLSSFSSLDLLGTTLATAAAGTNPLSFIGEAIGRSIRPDITRGAKSSSIRAVVLGGYMSEGQEALSYNMNIEAADGAAANRVQMVYIRVPEVHGMLPDPFCGDNSFTTEQQIALVEMHPTAAIPNWTDFQPVVVPGSIVEVEFIEGWSRGIVKKILEAATSFEFLEEMLAQSAFHGAGAFLGFPEQTPEEVKECAESYDSPPSPLLPAPNTSQHAPHLSTLHPEFLPYVKCFLWKCWSELGATITINSSYRSTKEQSALRAEYEACRGTGTSPCLPASQPGSSHHNFGWAIDFNPTLEDGTMLHSTNHPKSKWEESGIPALGESIGLTWGGYFSNYDPIHFDGTGLITESTAQLLERTETEGKEGNQLTVTLKT